MQIQENISLRPYNTFGIDAKARYFASFSSKEELEELLTTNLPDHKSNDKSQISNLVLGGGSNILFVHDVDGFVLKNELKGIELLHEDAAYVYVKAAAGENWHGFVQHCIRHNWAGVENLSLIPGNVGASPMQNIGAYGVEIQDVFWSLEAYHKNDNTLQTFTLSDCEFGYRESVFKRKYKDQFVILSVTFRLRKQPVFHTHYGAIEQELEKMGVKDLNINAVSQAVINIRSSKLPDPSKTGNAGSFFKNPSVEEEKYLQLKNEFADIVAHKNADETYKLAAGWLIEQCGWKGYRKGDAGCHERQALVLVNFGNASGKEIFDLSTAILESVKNKFGVELEREVNIV
ncbi:MAG: UDP-N-acetylmuramate dehydrogenase [Bacteroidetes bacterium]|nr:UDP-N-acetylmuramate dehydrogenase [Bacteroidota bacterium]